MSCGNNKKVACFTFGESRNIESFQVDQDGGRLIVDDKSNPFQKLSIEILPGTFNKETIVSLGYNDGELHLIKGIPSGIVLILDFFEHSTTIKNPIKINYSCSPKDYARSVMGYSIEESGALSPIDTIKDGDTKSILFLTFKPIVFTWVYTD